ncbi:uncharacterized protein LOC143119954 isoform X4 [Alosa pseudoharengus]|uniref:uncharacterized protein LOC143119954 isoform X4 n=1 Tax=Alosa pseudoharengus TaxID=34774 RepID=UPI003F88F157
MDLPLNSGGAETRPVDLSVIVKEEDIKEEEYGLMISCQDVKEERDDQEHDYLLEDNEKLLTIVKIEVKEEDEQEQDYLAGILGVLYKGYSKTLQARLEIEVKENDVDEQEHLLGILGDLVKRRSTVCESSPDFSFN